MATYYIDFENGNDVNAGTSFATRWKTITNGATAARIAPGDEIRIMASPNPTSIGNATWTGGGRQAAISIASSTNATPIVVTTSTAHGLIPGDYVSIAGHGTNTNANGIWKVGTTPTSTTFQILQIDGSNTTGNGTGGGTGNVTNVNNCIVKTATPLVQNIALCGGLGQKPVWTASTNVTTGTLGSGGKEGYGGATITIGGTFTTGKAAYYTLPATLNLSGYQQVSFWVQLASGTVGAAGQTYVALCSDSIGATVVHQCSVPALGSTGVWVPVTFNIGANLSSTINSVAFYVVTDVGAQTFYLDNIIACKAASSADSISLQSLVSKSSGTGTEAWYPILSINYDAIMLANLNSYSPNSTNIRGYSGASETVTTYKRETIKTTPATGSTSSVSTLNDNGTSANPITFTGGWDRTNMSTQTGRTWLDGLNGLGYGIASVGGVSGNFVNLDRVDLCRYDTGLWLAAAGQNGNVVTSIYIAGCAQGLTANASTSSNLRFTDVWFNNNGTGAQISGAGYSFSNSAYILNNPNVGFLSASTSYDVSVNAAYVYNNGIGVTFGGLNNVLTFAEVKFNGTGMSCGSTSVTCNTNYINSGSTTGNTTALTANNGATLYLNNFTINETTEVTSSTYSYSVFSNRHDDTDGNNWVFQPFGTINQQTAVVDSPATTAWRMAVTSTIASATAPVKLKLGTVVCAAGSLVTVTARMRRDDTGLTMRLVCPGGQISGVSSDVTSDMTAAANTWETVTITFTPTKPGGVDIYAYAFGGTTYSGYVCNLTASQA